MKLTHLTDKTLLNDTKILARHEREMTSKILHHIKEIDRRKLYSDLKCTSLFHYCMKELGYSESSAQRRIVAARMLEDVPEIEKKLESGKLTLSNISQVNQHFKNSDADTKREALLQVEGLSKSDCEKKLFEMTGLVKPSKPTIKRVSKDSVKVSITISNETLEALEEVKKLLGKNIDMNELIQLMIKTTQEKVEKDKFKQTEKPRKSPPPAEVGRAVSASVKREVYKRDKKCTNCGSKSHLNYDHIKAHALGGSNSKENIRLLCFPCNQRARMRSKL